MQKSLGLIKFLKRQTEENESQSLILKFKLL